MRRILYILALIAPTAALAHTGIGAHGAPFASGLAHPLLGADHLLAMLAVGLFAGLTGGRARWAYPAAFLAAMLLGGVLGVRARCCRGWSRRSSPRWWCSGRRPPSRCGRRSGWPAR